MPKDTKKLQSGDELALEALSQQSGAPLPATATAGDSVTDEAAASDDLAATLTHLQNVIERNANQLNTLKEELKLQREELRSYFENDTQLSEASEEADKYKVEVKERRSQLQNDPQAQQLKNKISELNEEKKEYEETISNHLINYYALTQSKSFDTSDGDQWEFDIKAKVRSR